VQARPSLGRRSRVYSKTSDVALSAFSFLQKCLGLYHAPKGCWRHVAKPYSCLMEALCRALHATACMWSCPRDSARPSIFHRACPMTPPTLTGHCSIIPQASRALVVPKHSQEYWLLAVWDGLDHSGTWNRCNQKKVQKKRFWRESNPPFSED
jgi:hypothetical protein